MTVVCLLLFLRSCATCVDIGDSCSIRDTGQQTRSCLCLLWGNKSSTTGTEYKGHSCDLKPSKLLSHFPCPWPTWMLLSTWLGQMSAFWHYNAINFAIIQCSNAASERQFMHNEHGLVPLLGPCQCNWQPSKHTSWAKTLSSKNKYKIVCSGAWTLRCSRAIKFLA